jgi:hypothetical protein
MDLNDLVKAFEEKLVCPLLQLQLVQLLPAVLLQLLKQNRIQRNSG